MLARFPRFPRLTFDRLLTVLAFLAVALAALLMPAQNDTWWHLRAGREIWTTGRVPLHDTFSFTAYGAFWPNHEWLSQAIFYAVYAAGGLPLLTVVCAAAVIGAWAIVWRLAPGSPRTKFLLLAWVLPAATTTWTLRPQAISLLLVAATVALLARRKYLWLPPLFLVWANLHGAVLTGLVLVVTAAIVERRRALAVAAAFSFLATLATPLGLHLWVEIPAFFIRVRAIPIDEFSPPRFVAPIWIPFWTATAALVLLAARNVSPRRWRRSAEASRSMVADRKGLLVFSALALLPMALTATRNVGPFLMLAFPALAALMPDRHASARVRAERPRLNVIAAAVSAATVAVVVASAYVRGADRLRWTPLPPASLRALDACEGRVYNRFDEGGYLIWFARDRQVFVDSRFLPFDDAFLAEHVRIERTGDVAAAVRRYDMRCAYLPAASLVARRLFDAGWTARYRDDAWTVLALNAPRAIARASAPSSSSSPAAR